MNYEVFTSDIRETKNGCHIHFVNIEDIDSTLQSFIEEQIVSIWDGGNDTPIDIVKIEIQNFLNTKSDAIKKGAIAEFIIHLYLKACGFNQECLFKNLEEGSIKKGFDGYYSLFDEEWIMESKSGSTLTDGISHRKKTKEAYDDLKSKIEGKGNNNPWNNAYNHAKVAGTTDNILSNIKRLSNNYVLNTFPDINSLNVIPTSTIFHEGNWEEELIKSDHDAISDVSEAFDYRKINIVCVNNKSIEAVIETLTQ